MYQFTDLKDYVEKELGISTDNVKSTFTPIVQKFTRKELDANVIINNDGIFFKDEDGKLHKGFLYIEKYNQEVAQLRGWNTLPRFHILNCRTLERQKRNQNFDGHYVFSQSPQLLKDVDDVVKDLSLCGYCKNEHNEISESMLSTEYVEVYIKNPDVGGNFNSGDLPLEFDLDEFGYTEDWDEKSKAYRSKMKYTCEDCGIRLNNNFSDGYYLETHHINGNKVDCNDANLKCLCVLCHANSNDHHKENYKKGNNQKKLDDFIKIYKEGLIKVGNKYLKK